MTNFSAAGQLTTDILHYERPLTKYLFNIKIQKRTIDKSSMKMHRLLCAIKSLSAVAFDLAHTCQAQLPISVLWQDSWPCAAEAEMPRCLWSQHTVPSHHLQRQSFHSSGQGTATHPLYLRFPVWSIQYPDASASPVTTPPRFGSCCHLPVIPTEEAALSIITIWLLHLGTLQGPPSTDA